MMSFFPKITTPGPKNMSTELLQWFLAGVQLFNLFPFPYSSKDRKMALVQLPSIDDAVAALIKMHNYQLSESNHLRVSFSKSSI